MDERFYMLILLPFFTGLCIFPDMRTLMVVSVSANVLCIIGVALLLYVVLTDTPQVEAHHNIADTDVWRFPIFVCGALYSLNNVPLVHCIERFMRDPKGMVNLCGVLHRSIIVIAAALMAVAIAGYSTYGVHVHKTILYNVKPSTEMQATEWAFILAFYLSYPINIFVLYDLIWEINLKNCLRGYPKCQQDCIGIALRISLVIISITLAAALPNFGVVDGFASAVSVPLLVMGFPAMIELCMCWELKDFGRCNYALLKDILLVVIASYCCIFGILEAIEVNPSSVRE